MPCGPPAPPTAARRPPPGAARERTKAHAQTPYTKISPTKICRLKLSGKSPGENEHIGATQRDPTPRSQVLGSYYGRDARRLRPPGRERKHLAGMLSIIACMSREASNGQTARHCID